MSRGLNITSERTSFWWNSIGGLLNAMQSVVVLMVITRTAGLTAAGIYSIAFATGNLFMYLGNYGVRNYQVSDLREQFSFTEYRNHRYLTVLLMLILSALFCLYHLVDGSYSGEKTAVVFAMCVLKCEDCIEEVFEGRLHQKGHLDLAGKMMTVRLIVSIGGMMAVLVLGGSLLASVIVAILLAVAAFGGMAFCYRSAWAEDPASDVDHSTHPVRQLMRLCFPVCAANFLSFYLINAPKYAIDSAMDETAQARYNFIAMPVFVIQLLTMFIYQPVMVQMTRHWQEATAGNDHDLHIEEAGVNGVKGRNGKIRKIFGEKNAKNEKNQKNVSAAGGGTGTGRGMPAFLHDFLQVVAWLLALSAAVLAGAYFLGIPVLSLLYATDLTDLKGEFMLLLFGSVFLAMNGFYCAVLTLMRLQNRIPLYYLAGTILSLILTPAMTERSSIAGAVEAFTLVMILVCALLTLQFAAAVRKTCQDR